MTHALALKRDQILVLVSKDFKLKYNSTALGFAWSLIVPIVTSLVYFFVFGVVMRWRAEHYALYLVSGNFMWQFFANVVLTNGRVLMSNSTLLKKTSFDRGLLIWGTFFTESLHFLLTIPVLAAIMLCHGVTPQWATVAPNLALALTCLTLLSVGLSYAYAAVNLYFRDLERIVSVGMMLWLFVSPVFIPIDNVPERFLWLYEVNPMGGILMTWRDIFWSPGFHPGRFLLLAPVCLAVFLFGRWLFRRLEPRFAEMM